LQKCEAIRKNFVSNFLSIIKGFRRTKKNIKRFRFPVTRKLPGFSSMKQWYFSVQVSVNTRTLINDLWSWTGIIHWIFFQWCSWMLRISELVNQYSIVQKKSMALPFIFLAIQLKVSVIAPIHGTINRDTSTPMLQHINK